MTPIARLINALADHVRNGDEALDAARGLVAVTLPDGRRVVRHPHLPAIAAAHRACEAHGGAVLHLEQSRSEPDAGVDSGGLSRSSASESHPRRWRRLASALSICRLALFIGS